MIKKLDIHAKITSRDETHLNLFRLIKILIEKIEELIDVVNELEQRRITQAMRED